MSSSAKIIIALVLVGLVCGLIGFVLGAAWAALQPAPGGREDDP